MDKINPDQLLTELMKIDVQMREMLCSLETNITTQEITPSGYKPPEATPEKVEHVAEKIIMALKNIEGQYRKYYHLFPQRREHVSRRSFREDSGIGSGIFNDDPAATEVCVPPIQESRETPDTEKTSAVEHSEGSDEDVSPQKTSAVEEHSEGSDKDVSPQKTSAVEEHSEGNDKDVSPQKTSAVEEHSEGNDKDVSPQKTSAVEEHSEGNDKDVSPQKTSAVEEHSDGSDKDVSPQKTSAVKEHSEGSDKESSHL